MLEAATPEQDIERLRSLGFEVIPTTGETVPGDAEDPAIPEVVAVEPAPAASSAAAADTPRMQILSAEPTMRPLIVGGNLAASNQFNFAVYLRFGTSACSASLVAPQWIKTAGHCVYGTSITPGSVTAYLGSVVRGQGAEVINADYFVKLENDTALVHLVSPSAYPPIGYNADPAFNSAAGPVVTMGWGRTSAGGPTSDLKSVENSTVLFDPPASLTIGTNDSYNTVCGGDSGGPNLRYNADGYPIDIATTSGTYYPVCTGRHLAMATSAIAPSIQAVIGVPPLAFSGTNRAPVVPAVAPLETFLGPTSLAIPASDPEGNPIVFAATGLPTGLSIDVSTGIISGTTTQLTDTQPSVVTVSVTDTTTAARRTVTFPWRVNTPGNASPVLAPVPSMETNAGAPAQVTATATDPNGDPILFSASGLPPGTAISPSGVITGTPNKGGTYSVNVYASDKKGGSSLTSFLWAVRNQNPSVHIANNGDASTISFAIAGQVSVAYTATESDVGDVVTVTAEGLPKGIVLDTATKTIRGSTTVAGLYRIVLKAEDTYGGSSATTFTLAISSASNRPPTITALQSRTDLPGVAIRPIPLNPVDPDGHAMVLAFNTLPPGLRYDATTKSIVGTPSKGGVFTVAYSVGDKFGGVTKYAPITWSIPNLAPIVVPPTAKTTLPGAPFTASFTGSDPEGHAFSVSATGLPKGLVVNNIAKAITGTPMASGTFSVTLTATDAYGGKSSAQPFHITIPNEAPNVLTPIANMTTVAGTPATVPINVADPEGHKLLITVNGINVYPLASSLPPGMVINSTTKTITGTPLRGGVYTVSLKVADVYGAYTNMPAFTWTIVNTKPTMKPVSNATLRIGSAASIQLGATDPESHPLTYKVTGLAAGLRVATSTGLVSGTPTAAAGTYRVAVYASDPYGLRSDTVNFTITLTN